MSGIDGAMWLRAYNRLSKAVERHMDAKTWTDDADDSLHHAYRSVMKSVGPTAEEDERQAA
jgi:hypothetical protein